jgi:hypothetical protein
MTPQEFAAAAAAAAGVAGAAAADPPAEAADLAADPQAATDTRTVADIAAAAIAVPMRNSCLMTTSFTDLGRHFVVGVRRTQVIRGARHRGHLALQTGYEAAPAQQQR